MANRFNYTGDYYVAVNGNDANNGTSPDTPFSTIQAGVTAMGTQSSKTLVIGPGIYNELISPPFGSANRSHTIQGDGDVIILGDNISDDQYNGAWGNGPTYTRSCTFNNIKFVNWHNVFGDPQGNQNYVSSNTYNNCVWINCKSMTAASWSNSSFFNDCIFIKSHFPFSHYGTQNKEFTGCLFLKSTLHSRTTIDSSNTINSGHFFGNYTSINSNTLYNRAGNMYDRLVDCIFANPFDDEPYLAIVIPKTDNDWTSNRVITSLWKNVVFSNECLIESVHERHPYYTANTERTDISHPFTQSATDFVAELKQYGTWLAYDGLPYEGAKSYIEASSIIAAPLSFNAVDLTGSANLENTLGAPYNLNFNNTDYFLLAEHPKSRTVANRIPGLGFGTNNTGSNPFHTTGGAVWDNIISTGSGFTISSSLLISGTIESAVIDQGSSKTLQDIQFNWSINNSASPNDAVLSYYTSSEGGYATPPTYQLRYSTSSANLSSEEYKVFPINAAPYLDANESGSGDINYTIGSENVLKARYLQFKLTLRNNWNG